MNKNLIIGNYINHVQGISHIDKETGRVRVKTYGNKTIEDGLMIECSKKIRESHPLGTLFTTENVKICKKPDGRVYVRAKDQMIFPL